MPTNLDFPAADPLTVPALAANQDDWGPNGSANASVWYVSASTAVDITGIAGGAANRLLRLVNVGANTITLKSQSSSSAAANRFLTSSDIALDAGEALSLTYVSGSTAGWSTLDAGAGAGAAANLSITARTSTTLGIASSTGTTATVPVATTSLGGLLTGADKTKLDAITGTNTGDQATNLSIASATSTTLDIASSTGTAATVPVATTSLGGLMSAADKTKLDGVTTLPPHTFHPLDFANNTALQAANQTFYMKVRSGYQAAATKIRLYIGTSSGNICVAVYAAGATPATRVATSGSVASPGTGMREITISPSIDITPGMWLSLSADNTTVTFGRASAPLTLSSAVGTGFYYYEASAFPAPSPATPTASWYVGWILIGA